MRIHVWGINYAPEWTGIGPHNTALCEFLRARGHTVEMFTTFAYYPAWKKAPEDCGRLFRTDQINGIAVHRCWHFVPGKPSTAKRIFHEFSFVLTSLLRMLSRPRPEVIVVVSPPLLLGVAAWLAGLVKRTPFVFHVQDLQPDAAIRLGMLKPGLFIRSLCALEKFAYRKAWRVSGISDGMLRAFAEKGVAPEKTFCFPNGIAFSEPPPVGRFRVSHGIANTDFLAVYSGNLGVKHGLTVLTDAAGMLTRPDVKLVICGDGAGREELERRKADLPNMILLPLQAPDTYREMLTDADLCLITQQAGSGHAFFPSKLLNALAFSKPVLAVADADSELARAVEAGKFGVVIPPGQPHSVAKALDTFAANPKPLGALGTAGRRYVEQFETQNVLTAFARCLEEAAVVGENSP